MAIFTVTTAADVVSSTDGRLSLREAISQANDTTVADTIRFASGLEGRTLTLTGGELVPSRDVAIDGDRNDDGRHITIDGNRASRIFNVTGTGTDVSLSDLTLTHGYANSNEVDGNKGGAVFLGGGSLTVTGSIVTGNFAGHYGGGIFADGGTVTIINSQINGNLAQYAFGGGISGSDNLTIRQSEISENHSYYAGSAIFQDTGVLTIEDSRITDNSIGSYDSHAIWSGGTTTVARTTISNNDGGIEARQLTLTDSTVTNNHVFFDSGGGIAAGDLVVRNSTITGNFANTPYNETAHGGGIFAGHVDIANSIVAGNSLGDHASGSPDIFGTIVHSNGHNIIGSDVLGNVSGDRENIAASAIFAAIDPDTGGGLLGATGIVPLRNSVANPALSGADLLAASAFGQLGGAGRPLPAGSLPDLGSIEINQPLSRTASANNDVLTGTAAANTINGLAGADLIKGLGGADTLRGGDGGDLLDGGAGNDRLYGDAGIDLVFYGGSAKVKVDLSLATDKATRGSETDTLYNVEGAIGSSAADSFKGNQYNNYFQGGLGKDTATGGSGRDTYDLNAIADSKAGATTRDVITDFAHLVDRIDLMGIDADSTVAGNQAFRWVGSSALTGPGELGFFTSGGNTIVRASNDADASSEFQIELTGIKMLTAADFYL